MTLSVMSNGPEARSMKSKTVQNRVWDAFLHGGSGHSSSASTLPYIMNRCEEEGIPYVLKAVPGKGYYIEKMKKSLFDEHLYVYRPTV